MKIERIESGKMDREKSREILNFISREFDYDFGGLETVTYRFCGYEKRHILSHCALTAREIEINGETFNSLLLGAMCIAKESRKQGLGSHLLAEIIEFTSNADYDLILLNCGESVVPFYKENGFSIISPKASYNRKEKIEVDNDPVMAFSLIKGLNLSTLQSDCIFLGRDF